MLVNREVRKGELQNTHWKYQIHNTINYTKLNEHIKTQFGHLKWEASEIPNALQFRL